MDTKPDVSDTIPSEFATSGLLASIKVTSKSTLTKA